MDITLELKRLIESKSIKKSDVARRLGISRFAVYNKLKNGKWKRLEIIELNRIFNEIDPF